MKVAGAWLVRSVRALSGHYESARVFENRATWLSIVSLLVGLTAAVLTAVVLAAPDILAVRIGAVAAAALASALGLLQTQLDYRARAVEHRVSGSGYSRIRRELETMGKDGATFLGPDESEHLEQLYWEVSKSAPTIPTKVWKDVLLEYPKEDEGLLLAPQSPRPG